ncbi:right-handed parallel beta-helix repeat-containing protein [Adhaeribacter pallidiroseus]|uniref:Right handed beta helix domain-containing protein n=1 Tax=Adhaeribacter pallidiroseus TaxID=2072847 RepID=A0A369QCU7_9BACT|nr:hypothetical protein [Adhaeribacter pallidiroseus]RDC62514.1 hypothetical protein AHMF7616_01108 [Adhaeribacter pallidiroseus]
MLKPLLLSTILLFSLVSTSVYAKILRVGYPGQAKEGIDYPDFQKAHDAAATGDVIQIYQHYGSISGGNVTKKLTIIGFGYLLDKNTGLQAINTPDTNAIYLYFQAGSKGSSVQGLYISGLQIYTNDITVSRCRISYAYLYNNESPLSGLTFKGCYFDGNLQETSQVTKISNLYIVNNIFRSGISLPNSSGFFANNISAYYYSNINLNSFLVKNNIFYDNSIAANGNIFENNIFFFADNATIIGTGNKFSVDMSTVFTNWNNSTIEADNQLTLKAGSPAKGAGKKNDGKVTDAGIFGGEEGDVYKLSGIPDVPAIYKLTAPSKTANTNPYTISVGVRSNN